MGNGASGMGHGAWVMGIPLTVDYYQLPIADRPYIPPITELSLLFQIFQLNPRIDRLQQQIRQQIPNNQHRRTHHQTRHY